MYFEKSKEELERNTFIEEARQSGMKQGFENGVSQGIKQRNMEIAKSMLQENMSLEIIQKITGLTKEEIENLANDK